MSTACVLLFDGFEEIEAISTVDVLRRGGVEVMTASLAAPTVTGAHQLALKAETSIEDLRTGKSQALFDALIIPGGPGVLQWRHNPVVSGLIQQYYQASHLVAAICAAPILLYDLGILEKHRYTAHFSMEELTPHARLHELVVTDGNIITGCGPAAGIPFGLAILRYLTNTEIVKKVAHGMMIP
ncbi:MAG: DJ-1/PfpI family protein [Opitutales bacterium]|nr:DJ-1/PfpI family protein [Opitutales bacterium]